MLAKAGALAAILLFSSAPCQAMTWGPYLARYVRAYDGDTVTLQILIWPDLRKMESVRIKGIDAPEIRGECDRERDMAIEARDRVRELLDGTLVSVTVYGFDKYGRALGDIRAGDKDVGQTLLDEGLARAYDGGARLGWCGVEG